MSARVVVCVSGVVVFTKPRGLSLSVKSDPVPKGPSGVLPVGRIRFELYGTMFTWREGDRKELLEIAAAAGVAELVTEASSHANAS